MDQANSNDDHWQADAAFARDRPKKGNGAGLIAEPRET
jgi:hypothetical protein